VPKAAVLEQRPQLDANHVGHLLDEPSVERCAKRRSRWEVGRAPRLSLRVDDALAAVERVEAVCAPVVMKVQMK
jgi:hypothetical protein